MTDVDVLLPCLDEAAALPWVLGRMPGWARPIVVDNGSTDGSPELARDCGATVVLATQRGYGSACHTGLLASTAPLVAVMDADGSLDPQQLDRLLVAYHRGAEARIDEREGGGPGHLVVGHRMPLGRHAWPWHLRVANRVVASRVNRATGLRLRDIGPMRLGPTAGLLALDIRDRRSGYPLETVLRAAHAGWLVTPVDVDYHPRVGRSKVTGTVFGAARAVLDMTRVLAK